MFDWFVVMGTLDKDFYVAEKKFPLMGMDIFQFSLITRVKIYTL